MDLKWLESIVRSSHFILHGGHVTCEMTGMRKLGNGLEMARIHRKMFFVFKENCFAGLE